MQHRVKISGTSIRHILERASRLICVLLIVCIQHHYAGAQSFKLNPDLHFDNYTGKTNFVSAKIHCVLHSRKGYIWAGGNGLFRFDGNQYRQFIDFNNQHHGLRDNYITHIAEDSVGRIWSGGSNGLCYYAEEEDKFKYVHIDDKRKINRATGLTISQGKLWFICNYGLCYVDLQTLRVYTTSFHRDFTCYTACFIDANRLVLCGDGDYFVYYLKEDRYEDRLLPYGLGLIWDLRVSNGVIWYGTSNGLWRGTLQNDTPRVVKGTENFSFMALTFAPRLSGDSILWLGTEGKGLMAFNIYTGKIAYRYMPDEHNPFSLSGVTVNAMYAGKEGRLWIATETGISQLNQQNQCLKTKFLPDKQIVAIAPDAYDSNIVWLSCYQRGLLKVDWRTKKVIHDYNGNFTLDRMGPVIFNMLQTGKHEWLCSGWADLFVWNELHGMTKLYPYETFPDSLGEANVRHRQIIRYNKDECFFLTSGGLYLFHIRKGIAQPLFLRQRGRHNPERDLFFGEYDQRRYLWMGTYNGLGCYDMQNRQYRNYKISGSTDSANANIILDARIDKKGRIVCGTKVGMAIFDPATRKFSVIEELNGLRHPHCASIIIDDTIAWINTNAGVVSYNLNTGQSFINDFIEKGKYTERPFGRMGNEILEGSKYEINYFDPGELLKQSIPSPPVIEKIVVNDKPLYFPRNSQLSLQHDQNLVTFFFTAFEYNDPAHIHFRYKLEGADKDWVYTTQRQANYTHIPPGKYIFKVQAGNKRDDWNTTQLSYAFEIVPPFWQTWWFRVLSVVAFIGIATGIAALRIRTIKKREMEKTEHNREIMEMEMKALRSQMNPHFIFNSLNSIQRFIWDNKQEDAAEYLTKFSRLIRMILDNSMQKFITLEQEINCLSLYIELEHRRCNNKFDYTINVDSLIAADTILVPPLILQPYVENAIWHGLLPKEDRGLLKIEITAINDELITCTIEDNGIGRKMAEARKTHQAAKPASHGMNITRHRIEMLVAGGRSGRAVIEDIYDDAIACGTKVIVEIPVSHFVKV